jgi:UDP-2-acetamido-3-amino-2,3-dideoxy-glucuronate N-acetyltransferase
MSEMKERPGGYFVHESSYVDEGAEIGRGTRVWHFCHVNGGAVIGERCSLGQNVVVMPGTRLGNNVKVQNNVSIYEGVECDDDVFLGPSMVFTNVTNPRSHVSRKHEYKRTPVGRGASIGANATIICGNALGEYCFIGAGAVVTRDVPAYALVAGVPARVVGWMCQCGERLDLPDTPSPGAGVACSACGTRYSVTDQGPRPIKSAPEAERAGRH